MKSIKNYIIYVFAIFFLIGVLILFSGIFIEGGNSYITKKPVDNSFQSFSETLWENWGLTIIIVAFIIFASGAGILVLLRGT